jgi:hypothetical protein
LSAQEGECFYFLTDGPARGLPFVSRFENRSIFISNLCTDGKYRIFRQQEIYMNVMISETSLVRPLRFYDTFYARI